MNKKHYEEDLKRKQEGHLKNVQKNFEGQKDENWRPCLHDGCPECFGTGTKLDGSPCIHYISCSCPKCTTVF